MSKIKIRLKLQGFELEVEGDRADIPAINRGIKDRLTGIIEVPAAVTGIDLSPPPAPALPDLGEQKSRKKRARQPASTDGTGSAAIDFRHDGSTYGMPTQEWNTGQKAMWLLHVLNKQTDTKELSTGAIAATFNKHFRQAKEVARPNVHRDLGKAKIQTPSLVGEDTSSNPSRWYLTDAGVKYVEKLIAEQQQSS